MNVKYNYYNFDNLSDEEKGNFIIYILNECKYDINMYQYNLGDYYKEDFLQDISLLILNKISDKSFNFHFYTSYKDYRKNILSDKNNNVSFVYAYLEKGYLKEKRILIENKEQIILSKDFYKKFKEYSFERKFIAYIKKIIKHKWVKYTSKKNEFLKHTVELTSHLIDSVSINDNLVVFLAGMSYLSDDDKKLLKLFSKKSQSEIAKEFHITQQSVSYRLNKIRKKLKSYEKV